MSKFLDFLGDLKAYVPSGGDVLKILGSQLLTSSRPTNSGVIDFVTKDTTRITQAALEFLISEAGLSTLKEQTPDSFYKDGAAVIYPEDLFQSGNEAYILFYLRDSVYADAKLLKRVALYMPANVSVSYGAEWNPINMFITQDQRGSLKTDATDLLNQTSISSALDKVSNILSGSGQDAIMTAISKSIGQAVLNETAIGQGASAIAGKTVNPMTALAFRSVNLRKFRFNFELLARSVAESESIRQIINIFKYGMHPASVKNVSVAGQSDATANSLAEKTFLNYPDTFDIYLFSPSMRYLFQIQRSVLLNMDVNYNGRDVASFFKGTGAPTNINLTLDFQETEFLTKERVVSGY